MCQMKFRSQLNLSNIHAKSSKAPLRKVGDKTSLLRGDLLLYCMTFMVGSNYFIFPSSSVEFLILNQLQKSGALIKARYKSCRTH